LQEFDRIARIYPSLVKAMSRLRNLMAEGMDLSYNQYKTLLTLYDLGPVPPGTLSRQLRVAGSSMSEMIDRLEKAGLVARRAHGGDRRSIRVELTEQGEELLRRLQEGVMANYRRLMEDLPPTRRRRLVRAIEDLVEIIGGAE
jgi:DNA-binding MarR family transcriptional regulator